MPTHDNKMTTNRQAALSVSRMHGASTVGLHHGPSYALGRLVRVQRYPYPHALGSDPQIV